MLASSCDAIPCFSRCRNAACSSSLCLLWNTWLLMFSSCWRSFAFSSRSCRIYGTGLQSHYFLLDGRFALLLSTTAVFGDLSILGEATLAFCRGFVFVFLVCLARSDGILGLSLHGMNRLQGGETRKNIRLPSGRSVEKAWGT